MKIYLASDHAGFDLKEEIKVYLQQKSLPAGRQGYEVEDVGNFQKVIDDDYPDFISKAAEKVSNNKNSKGVVFGKSGAGECIVANKFKGIRAVVGFNKENVELSRIDNNANVLCLGSQFTSFETAKELVDIFLQTPFSNEERHIRRINKINDFER